MKKTIYTGTYTGTGSEGIYRFTFEDGKLTEPSLFCKMKNPKYLSLKDGVLAAVADFPHGAGVSIVDESGNIMDTKVFEKNTSCYVGQTEQYVLTANYHEGSFSILTKEENKLKLVHHTLVFDGGGCHQVLVWNDLFLVPSLFLDRIVIYNQECKYVDSIRFDSGCGPRHGIFSKDKEYLYLVSELSNELFVIHCGDWKIVNHISVLPNEEKHVRGGAAIRMNEEGNRIYISTRGKDVISVIDVNQEKLSLVQVVSCGGKHPRDFILCDGYLLCANRNTNEVVSFELHEDGTVGKIVDRISIQEPVSLVY